jgi:Protein of unknown function (DUF1997)
MQLQVSASQSVELPVTELAIPIQQYLRQPQRLVHALADPSRVDVLSAECFRLKMRSLQFMMLSIQPTVDLRLWMESDGAIRLQSIRSEIRGADYIDQRFHLQLDGRLAPITGEESTTLAGKANLSVEVDLPPVLWMTPKPLLEAAGNGLLRSVLLTIKQRLMHQLILDYRNWVQAQCHEPTIRSGRLSPQTPSA